MKTAAALLLAASALASAQVTYNETTGVYTCDKPNVAYCAGNSLGTDIIIRCDANRRGQPGRCSDNLAGQFPVGVKPALCYEAAKDGSAACEKNCVVYAQPSFTLPASVCTPTATQSTTTAEPTTTITYIHPAPTTTKSTTTITYINPAPTSKTTTITYINPAPTSKTTLTTTYVNPTRGTDDCGSTGVPVPPKPSNGTCHSCSHTPVPPKPTTTSPSGTRGPSTVPTAGASANQVGGMALAAAGLVAAYFL